MRMAAAAVLAVLAFAGSAHAAPHAVVAFLPHGPGETRPLLEQFAARGMAIGVTSPTVGGFDPRQMGLDMSQGARIPTRVYSKRIGALALRSGRLSDWGVAVRRADRAPGDVVPGLLASTIEAAGRRVGYSGSGGGFSVGAIVAANEQGRVFRARAGDALDVVTLAPGAAGLRQLDRLRADFVYVVEAPYGSRLRLLPSGVRAAGIHGQLRSATTRRDGLIAATDVAPTVLRALGLKVPDAMQGEPIEGRGTADARALLDASARLSVVTDRRGLVLEWLVVAWAIVLALCVLAGQRRRALRIGLLAAIWVPGLALLTAALEPSRTAEAAIVGVGSVLLAVATDAVVPWPVAPAAPAAIVFVAHAIDLAFGSPLIGASIAGPNPAGGARFFGIGNELETILSVSVLIGAGAALCANRLRRPATDPRAPLGFAVVAIVAAGIMGAGRLGADVGAVITLGAGGAAAVIASLSTRPSRGVIALGIAAPVAAVIALVALDLATGGNGHLTRSVVHSHGSGSLADTARRRFDSSFASLGRPGWAIASALALIVIVWLASRARALFAAVPRPFAAGVTGAWFATLVGAIANDSGPLILVVGTIFVLLSYAYIRAATTPDS